MLGKYFVVVVVVFYRAELSDCIWLLALGPRLRVPVPGVVPDSFWGGCEGGNGVRGMWACLWAADLLCDFRDTALWVWVSALFSLLR